VEISTKAALFDEAIYCGSIATDLFGEDRYFTDPDEFWRLQNAAIAETRGKLVASGWREVAVIAPDQRFAEWDYGPCAKSKGGGVYIDVGPDGYVTLHKGLTPRGKAGQRTKTAMVCEQGSDEAAPTERPEMSAPLANYVDITRHSEVRLAVAAAPKVALRLVLAHMIGGGLHCRAQPEPQTPHNEAIAAWRDTLPPQTKFAELRRDAVARLGLEEEILVAPDHDGARTAAAFERLMELTDKDVLALLAVVMAETLAMGTGLIDTLGTWLEVDVGAHWQPDDLFFDPAKDREAVGAVLTEVIGETASRSYLTETGTRKKALIRKALVGDGRTKVEGWLPRYMKFPQAAYTQRATIAQRRRNA
jgi:ParB family transcriptional regulator, chromosome partitioning protein